MKRLIIQFRKGYRRSDKSLCMSSSRFVAHLVNQRVVSVLVIERCLSVVNVAMSSFLRATAVPAGTAEARISYGNSVRLSVTTRWYTKPR